jgi:hypothetical protein
MGGNRPVAHTHTAGGDPVARTGFRRAAAVMPVEIDAAIFAVYAQQLQFPAGWSDDQGGCYL